jgi:outer membrane protein
MNPHIRFLVLAVVAGAAAQAQAQAQTLKLGYIYYDPHSRTNGVTGIGIPPGADANVKGAGTLLLTYEVELKPDVGAEFVLGVPPKIRADATGPLAFLGEVLAARNLSPTLLFNYHFGKSGDALRPYLGVGVNYSHFTNITTPYGWNVKLSDSVGLAAQAGLDYALAKQWGLYASVARVDVRSKLVATGATVLQSTIDFRPWTYSFGASFKF